MSTCVVSRKMESYTWYGNAIHLAIWQRICSCCSLDISKLENNFPGEILLSIPYLIKSMKVVSAPCILAPVLLYFLPESPRWLIAKGRISKAR